MKNKITNCSMYAINKNCSMYVINKNFSMYDINKNCSMNIIIVKNKFDAILFVDIIITFCYY